MALPITFQQQGFTPYVQNKLRRLMIGTDGPSNSGKTEFALSAPDPGIVLCLDRGFDAVFDNPNPPASRGEEWAFKTIQAPLPTQATQPSYIEYWRAFYDQFKKALEVKEARTIVIDGDSDSWELQRLAEFGKLTQIPSILYSSVNAARRAMYARAWDSGKIIIATNKISKEYKVKRKPDGSAEMKDGKEVREWDGKSFERQGFADQDYLFQLQLRHIYEPPRMNKVSNKEIPGRWGILIMKCKANPELQGTELWDTDCNFQTLVELVYPQVPLKDWGF